MTQLSIAYPEMQKSSLVLFDMAAFYLPLYGYTWKAFFPHYGVIGLVEGLIYQTEVRLEAAQPSFIWPDQHTRILAFLQSHHLDNELVRRHLNDIGEYFSLVHQITHQRSAERADIIRTMELRPADLRLLHTILAQQLGEPYDEGLFDLLWPLEVVFDIKANVNEYADDVQSGHYNTYQQLVTLDAKQAMKIIQAEQLRYQSIWQERLASASAKNQQRVKTMISQYEHEYATVLLLSQP